MSRDVRRPARYDPYVRTLLVAAAISMLLPGLVLGCRSPGPLAAEDAPIPLEFDPAFAREPEAFEGWGAYLMARVSFQRAHPDAEFPFEEELRARQALASFCSSRRSCSAGYFLELVLVMDAGFLPEYVWTCLRRPHWPQPSGLRQPAFAAWMSDHLPHHLVETRVDQYRSGEFAMGFRREKNCAIVSTAI
jgi:hypothetical protein